MTDKLISDLVAGVAALNTIVEILLDGASTSTKETIADILNLQNDQAVTLTNHSIVASQLSGIIADARMPNLTGDVTTSEGAVNTSIAADVIIDADVKSDAAIAFSKLEAIPRFSLNSNKKVGSFDSSRFFAFFSDSTNGIASEGDSDVVMDNAFVITRTRINNNTNTKSNDTTVHFRDDANDSNSITLTAGVPAEYDSGALSVSVAAGSLCDHEIDTSTSSSGNLGCSVIMTTCNNE